MPFPKEKLEELDNWVAKSDKCSPLKARESSPIMSMFALACHQSNFTKRKRQNLLTTYYTKSQRSTNPEDSPSWYCPFEAADIGQLVVVNYSSHETMGSIPNTAKSIRNPDSAYSTLLGHGTQEIQVSRGNQLTINTPWAPPISWISYFPGCPPISLCHSSCSLEAKALVAIFQDNVLYRRTSHNTRGWRPDFMR